MYAITFFLALLFHSFALAHTWNDKDIFGELVQIRLELKHSGARPIGVELYKVWMEGKYGDPVFARRSYYRYGSKSVTEDRDWINPTGIAADSIFEIDHRFETQTWVETPDVELLFNELMRQLSEANIPIGRLRAMYIALTAQLFRIKDGEPSRVGSIKSKWSFGLQRLWAADVAIEKSEKYGNRFSAKFAQ